MAIDICSQNAVQANLFDTVNREKDKNLMSVLDSVNNVYSGDADPHSGDADPPLFPEGPTEGHPFLIYQKRQVQNYCFFLLIDSPFRIILCEALNNLSKTPSATVFSVIISYHFSKGI